MTTDRDDAIRQGWIWYREQNVVGLPEPPPDTRFADTIELAKRLARKQRMRWLAPNVEATWIVQNGWIIEAELWLWSIDDSLTLLRRWRAA